MDISSLSFFSMLKGRLNLMADRQRVLAENVANANTAGYVARDVDVRAFERAVERGQAAGRGVGMARTAPGHMGGPRDAAAAAPARVIARPDSEVTLDGNAVVLEEQMIRIAETRTQYDAAIGLYQKGLQLVRLAARAPGR